MYVTMSCDHFVYVFLSHDCFCVLVQSLKLPTDFVLSLQTDEDLRKSVTTVSVCEGVGCDV